MAAGGEGEWGIGVGGYLRGSSEGFMGGGDLVVCVVMALGIIEVVVVGTWVYGGYWEERGPGLGLRGGR